MRRDPKANERALRGAAALQGGYFTAAEARRVGYGYRQQHFHRERGNWLTIERGIYRFPDFPDGDHEDLIRWALWSRDRKGQTLAVVSHEAALGLHELGEVMPADIHLTVPPGFRKRPSRGCVLHRARLCAAEIEEHLGFFATTPVRTLLDVAGSALSPEHLQSAIRDGLARGVIWRGSFERLPAPPGALRRIQAALLALSKEVA